MDVAVVHLSIPIIIKITCIMCIKKIMYPLLVLIMLGNYCMGHIRILDKQTKEPISFAHIISNGGHLVATSAIDGSISIDNFPKFQKSGSDSLIVQHISYSNLKIGYEDLLKSKDVYLEPRNYSIPEFEITRRQPDYIVLRGFFRSYQLDNNIPKYYTDGIVEYIINLKGNKKLTCRTIECRSYKNDGLIDKEAKRTNTVSIAAAGIPYIESEIVIDQLGKGYSLLPDSDGYKIKKDTIVIGKIVVDKLKDKVHIGVDLLAPRNEEVHSLFGYTSRIVNIQVSEDYRASQYQGLSKGDIACRKEYRRLFFKHKKEKEPTQIDVIHEFFVISKNYMSKAEVKSFKRLKSFGLPKTNFSTNYWDTVSKDLVPNLNINIEKLLGRELKLYK